MENIKKILTDFNASSEQLKTICTSIEEHIEGKISLENLAYLLILLDLEGEEFTVENLIKKANVPS